MDFFEEAALRLKQQLKVKEDKEVAAFLGMSASALNMRKKRGNFPIKEVFALAAQRPELGLDPDWIVTGSSNKMETSDSREASLLQCFRKLKDRDQQRLLEIALLLSGEMVLAIPPTKSAEKGK
jgi:transcriptional regulator with XRE-family HTH domain